MAAAATGMALAIGSIVFSCSWNICLLLLLSTATLAGCFRGGEELSLCESNDDIAVALGKMPFLLEAGEVPCEEGARCFEGALEVPLHMDEPLGEQLSLAFRLVHKRCDAPTVLTTHGYDLGLWHGTELSYLYDTNSMFLEHRYQGQSIPATADWDFSALTIENGAHDVHLAVGAIGRLYSGPLITTGASKSGQTALYHRFIYPNDVDGTVPYVAPISLAARDTRYMDYLEGVGDSECRERLRQLQIAMLTERRTEIISAIAGGRTLDPESLEPYEEWLEGNAGSAEWAFWQYNGVWACENIPSALDSVNDIVSFLDALRSGALPAEDDPEALEPEALSRLALLYEWATEQGFAQQVAPAVLEHFAHERQTFPERLEEQLGLIAPTFDPSINRALLDWVREEATGMVLIYGENDPWSGGRVEAGPAVKSCTVPDGNHSAIFLDLPTQEREHCLAAVSRLMGYEPSLDVLTVERATRAARDQLQEIRRKDVLLRERLIAARP